MNIAELRDEIAMMEHGKKQVDIAQISEVLRCINKITYGGFYPWARKNTPERETK